MGFPVHRFKNLREHRFDVEIITPLFLGGADQTGAELRAPSLKGMMRFWWRALYGRDDIAQMKKDEAEIFGDTNRKSDVVISLVNTGNLKPEVGNIAKGKIFSVTSKGKTFFLSIIEYLAYGLKSNVFTRAHFEPRQSHSFILKIECSSDYEEQVLTILKLLHSFGGLGAKSRNGFGSLSIHNLSDKNPEEEFQTVKSGSRKKFTSFSLYAKLFLFKEQRSWDAALSDAGLAYKNARNELEGKHSFDRRQLIAKPIIVKHEVDIQARHAKPYFLHVHKMENGRFRGQILFLPYQYHKDGQLQKYDKACKDMNNTIRQADNFIKEVSASREGV